MFKSSFAVAIASTALVSTAFAASTIFSDVPDSHWASASITEANHLGIMTGPGDMPGKFDPAGVVNRAQLATVSMRVYDMLNQKNVSLQEEIDLLTARVKALEPKTSSSSVSSVVSSSSVSSATSSSSVSSVASSAAATVTLFQATLNGASEVPATTSAGTGSGSFTLQGNTLTYTITVTGLTGPVTAAHFHTGAAGVSGPVAQPLTYTGTRAAGTWTLTDAQKTDLLAGNLYVNFHTDLNPNGEIRGQVLRK